MKEKIKKKPVKKLTIEELFSKSDKEITALLENAYRRVLEKNPDLSSKLLAEKALKLACPEITDDVAESLAFQYHDIDNLILGLLQMKKEHKKLKKYEPNKE